MNYAVLLPTYLYLFASQFLPSLPKESPIKDKFIDSAQQPVHKKELENILLAVTLFELKKQQLLLLEGNGNVTFVKKTTTDEALVNGLPHLQKELLTSSTTEPTKLLDLIATLKSKSDVVELVKKDLVVSKILVDTTVKKLVVIKEIKLLPDPTQLTLLAGHLSDVQIELENLKKDSLFNDVLSQLKTVY